MLSEGIKRTSPARTVHLLALTALMALVPSGVLIAGEGDPGSTTTTSVTDTTVPPDSTESPESTESPASSEPPPSSTDAEASTTVSSTIAPPTVATTTTTTTPTTTTTATTTTTTPPSIAMLAVAAAAPPAATCSVSLTVRLGTRGDPARCVETRLVQLGYWLSGPNDNFDSTAVNALKAFQTREGMTADGVAGKSTLQALGVWTEPRALPAPTCYVSTAVKLGTRGNPARCLETRLVQLGYWLSGPNDSFDSTAVHALRIVQSRYGLSADGVAGRTILNHLGIWREPQPMPAATCSTSWAVYPGDFGFPARCVQDRLVQLGYWLVGPDDTFDSTAVNALKAFQAKWGLASTGIADYTTLARLGIWRALNRPAATCKVHYAVRSGGTGVDARCVETRLRQLGYWLVGPNDTFDGTAVTALKNFQYKNGLVNDGIAGQRTLMRLGIYNPNPPPATALPSNSGSGRRIVYSRAQQRIWAVDANGVVVKTHRVSGRTYEPYASTYHVYSRSLYTNSVNDPSVRWRYMVRFAYGPQGGRIGFHEIPNRNGRPLQTKEQLGLPLSGGCVRQSTADALWIWNWAGIGTTVVVL